MHKYQTFHIEASAQDEWRDWPPQVISTSGVISRPLNSGQESSLVIKKAANEPLLLILLLGEPFRRSPSSTLQVSANESPLHIQQIKAFPELLAAVIPAAPATAPEREIGIRFRASGQSDGSSPLLLLGGVLLLPLEAGRFSMRWTSWGRALRSLLSGKRGMSWKSADFPYSHFDGIGYLLEQHEARTAVLSRRYHTAFHYFMAEGRGKSHALRLATHRPPTPGTPFNLVTHHHDRGEYLHGRAMHFEKRLAETEKNLTDKLHNADRNAALQNEVLDKTMAELKAAKEEGELLLFQLHQVQEELENCFLENQKLQESQSKLAELEKTVQELRTSSAQLEPAIKSATAERDSALTARDQALTERDSALTARDQALTERDAAFSSRDQALSERASGLATRDNAVSEAEILKKTLSERALRIAELEAQIAEQSKRQRQIDEELAKAEGQLQMLKDLLHPALS
jgi:hypothetical protein